MATNPFANYPYPFDPTGTAATNKITNEIQTITAVNYSDYNFIVPRWAPFFVDSFKMTYRNPQGQVRELVEGIDFLYAFWFISASRACSKPIYGGISFLNTDLSGSLVLEYQTLGGMWTLSETQIANILAERLHNPRITSWDSVSEMPANFPVIDHEWDLVDMVGAKELETALNHIRDAILAAGGSDITAHLMDYNNPHRVTKAQVGLGNVNDYATAVLDADATSAKTDLYMTPRGVGVAIGKYNTDTVQPHISNKNNPHAVTKAQVGLSEVNNYRTPANDTEATSNRTDLYMTPQATQIALAKVVGEDIQAHINDHDNPHRVTAEQIGVYTKSETNVLLSAKLDVGGVAADSSMLDGKDYAAVKSDILSGTADNSNNFDSKSYTEVKSDILSGTAANADKVFGMNQSQLSVWVESLISDFSGSTPQVNYDSYTAPGGVTNTWTKIATFATPFGGSIGNGNGDMVLTVVGGEGTSIYPTPIYQVVCGSDGAGGTKVAYSKSNASDAVLEFGYVSIGGGQAELYAKTAGTRNDLTVTLLSNGGGFLNTDTASAVVEVEPSTYQAGVVLASNYVTSTELENVLDTLTATFTAIAANN